MSDFDKLSTLPLFNNSLLKWPIALGVAAVTLTVLLIVRHIVRRYHAKMQATTETELLEIPMQVLSRTTLLLLIVISLFRGAQALWSPLSRSGWTANASTALPRIEQRPDRSASSGSC